MATVLDAFNAVVSIIAGRRKRIVSRGDNTQSRRVSVRSALALCQTLTWWQHDYAWPTPAAQVKLNNSSVAFPHVRKWTQPSQCKNNLSQWGFDKRCVLPASETCFHYLIASNSWAMGLGREERILRKLITMMMEIINDEMRFKLAAKVISKSLRWLTVGHWIAWAINKGRAEWK